MNTLQLLNPLGLLALGALLAPLLIHLFNRSRAQDVLVGNIALYRQPRRQRVPQLQLQQWLLLALRLLLLALAALWLAGLARSELETLRGSTAYVTPEWLQAHSAPGQAPMVAAGTGTPQSSEQPLAAPASLGDHLQVFVLAEGFAAPSRAVNPATAELAPGAPSRAFSLLAHRLRTVRHEGEIHVYAMGAANQFSAQAPALGALADLHWHLAPPAPDAPDRALPALAVQLLHTPARAADAQAMATALSLLATHRTLGVQLAVRQVEPGASTAGGPDAESIRSADRFNPAWADAVAAQAPVSRHVLIWLGEGNAPTGLPEAAQADLLLSDSATGNGAPVPASLPFAGHSATPLALRPATVSLSAGDHVLWRAHNGAPLLVETRRLNPAAAQGEQVHLQHLECFTTAPRGLMANDAFPDLLLRLLLGETAWAAGSEHSPADPTQAVARTHAAAPVAQSQAQPIDTYLSNGLTTPLTPWLALLMALIFALERWLSERPARAPSTTRAAASRAAARP